MDLILLAVGGILYFAGSRTKDESGMITSGGKTMRVIGIVVFAIGIILVMVGFMFGFLAGFSSAF